MVSRLPRVFTVSPDQPFLEVLARAVRAGFPRASGPAPDPMAELPAWTILLPTRRAVRELEQIFMRLAGGRGALLPRIRPLGDIDEDLFQPEPDLADASGLPPAMSQAGRELLLMSLIDDWAAANPHLALAAEIAEAPTRAQGLAASLAEFIDGLETEDVDAQRIRDLFDLETARHRDAILSFLTIVQQHLPNRLLQRGFMGRKARQSRVLLQEALRLAETPPDGPVIAAGSTGSIPATRTLLKAISHLPQGAVVLPGLDLDLDEASWTAAGPQHPQFILKQLLSDFGVARSQISRLPGSGSGPRVTLAQEAMRPPETSDLWRSEVPARQPELREAFRHLALVEAADRNEESLVIALMLREVLETPGATANLITPDRDLARRVKQDLKRWAIDIDDSAGEPLIAYASGAFTGLLLDAIDADFSAESLNALFLHPLCSAGLEPLLAQRAAQTVDLALFRGGTGLGPPSDWAAALLRIQTGVAGNRHAHPSVAGLSVADWGAAEAFLHNVASCLTPLDLSGTQPFAQHVQALTACLDNLAGPALYDGETGTLMQTVVTQLAEDAAHASPCSMARVTGFVRRQLTLMPFRPQRAVNPRLAILGLLEARLLRADVHILGGLNESVWPALPDSGPWLNRPMRETVGLQLPERSIGQTAHDFVQALGADNVRLVWARRIGDAPAIPSRWVLRLRMIASKIAAEPAARPWLRWARALDAAERGQPCAKPKPQPPVDARPRRLSVTQIETLIRDPYAIYARHVLKLQPLDPPSTLPGPALRGTLFHQAIGDFLTRYPDHLPEDSFAALLDCARPLFAAFEAVPLVTALWWPRFISIARWLAEEEIAARPGIRHVHAEAGAAIDLETPAGPFRLTGRADRIDILTDGTARIIDYKTGAVPSGEQIKAGLAPQLPLEAAMLKRGAFRGIGPQSTSAIVHVKLRGGDDAGEVLVPSLKEPVEATAERSWQGLLQLLGQYAVESQAYLPRAILLLEDDVSDYDHLSRYREWVLAGTGS